MIFAIFQNHSVRNNSDLVNSKGWDGAAKEHAGIEAHLEMSFSGDDGVKWKDAYFPHYAPVAIVAIDEHIGEKDIMVQLERVFSASNGHGQEFDDYCNFGKAASLSVGDLVRTPEGDFYVVAGCGFQKIEVQA